MCGAISAFDISPPRSLAGHPKLQLGSEEVGPKIILLIFRLLGPMNTFIGPFYCLRIPSEISKPCFPFGVLTAFMAVLLIKIIRL
jgi:hypothetical protein